MKITRIKEKNRLHTFKDSTCLHYSIRRVEIMAADHLGQAKDALTHVHRSATNPKNICFVEYKHKFFGQR